MYILLLQFRNVSKNIIVLDRPLYVHSYMFCFLLKI